MHLLPCPVKKLVAGLALASFTCAAALAANLTVGIASEPSSVDPMFHALTPNFEVALAIFDPLVAADSNFKLQPALAESWSADGNVWTFKLRPNVKFSDGSPFTAEDVVFSFNRVGKVPNSPSPLTIYTSTIKSVTAVDPLTVKIETKGPDPILPNSIAIVAIMSHKAAAGPAPEGKTTTELNRGDGLIGTGPYKFVSWQRGADIVLERNPEYWGPKPAWDKVILRPIINNSARVAALLSKDVDVIEQVPADDLPKLRKDKNVHLAEKPSNRLIFISMEQTAAVPPGMQGTDGKNPLADKRVREALSLAVNRKGIVDRVLNGAGVPAGDLQPYPLFGTSKELSQAPKFDLKKAKELMSEAGWGKGFAMSLGSPAGRYPSDERVSQAIAAMWSQLGVKADVQAMASALFFAKRRDHTFSSDLSGWLSSTGENSNSLKANVMTRNAATGYGSNNYSGYGNPKVDELIIKATQTLNDDERSKLLQEAAVTAMHEEALLPLYFVTNVWGMQNNIAYGGATNEMTLVQDIKPKQ
jgi:peptide/nickel transport system substrate-binding protein